MEMTTHWRIEWTNAKNEMETVGCRVVYRA